MAILVVTAMVNAGCATIAVEAVGAGAAQIVPPPRSEARARYEPIAIDPEWTERLRALVRITRAGEPVAAEAEALGRAEAASCYQFLGDYGTENDALVKLRYRAFRAGANAIEQVVCEAPEGMSRHCFQSVACRGVLVREALPGGRRAHRPELGTLAVLIGGQPAEVRVKGWGEDSAKAGAAAGTATGVGAGLALCAGTGPYAVAICPATILWGALIGAVGGTAVGRGIEANGDRSELESALGAELPEDHAARNAVRRQIVARLRERLANEIVEPALERRSGETSPNPYASLFANGVGSVAEIHLVEVGVRSLGDGPVQQYLRARLRLIGAADGRTLHDEMLDYADELSTPRAMIERGGDALHRAFERSYRGLAEQIASVLSQPNPARPRTSR